MKAQKLQPFHTMITLADLVTLLNLFSGLLAGLFSLQDKFGLASIALVAAVVFDYLDGKVARLFNQKGVLGRDLDSLCDAVSFGAMPTLFAFSYGLTQPLSIVILLAFCGAGILRLARFNVLKIDYYVGMPITFNGILIPLAYVLGLFSYGQWPLALYGASAILMVSPLRLSKYI